MGFTTHSKLSNTIHFCNLNFKIKESLSLQIKDGKGHLTLSLYHICLIKGEAKSTLQSTKTHRTTRLLCTYETCHLFHLSFGFNQRQRSEKNQTSSQTKSVLSAVVLHTWPAAGFEHKRTPGRSGSGQQLYRLLWAELCPLSFAPQIHVEALALSTSEYDRLWKQGL